MQPRIVFRTHYQVDEPVYLQLLVRLCTSPVESAYAEAVAERLAHRLRARGKDFNIAAGQYAVDLARALGLITPNQTWTNKGHLVNLVAETPSLDRQERLSLTPVEKLLHFRLFLEGDGAALQFMARQLLHHGQLPCEGVTWNSLARDMFVEVFSQYLALTGNTVERVALRGEIERIKLRGYTGNTGPHKAFVHLQTLYRLGLVARPDSSTSRIYQLPDQASGTTSPVKILLDRMPNALSLENVLNDRRWVEVAAETLQLSHRSAGALDEEQIVSVLLTYYRKLMSTGAPLCPISTVVEATQIELLAKESVLVGYQEVVKSLEGLQQQRPRDVRFHVDRTGHLAFVKLSDELTKKLANGRT